MLKPALAAIAAFTLAMPALAGMDAFGPGTVVPSYGKFVSVPGAELPADASFRVAFDVSDAGPEDGVNRYLESAARLLNMQAAAGVPVENMSVAIVVHGPAAADLLTEEARGTPNPNAGLISELAAAGVSIQLCGQTAAAKDIEADDLLPGVTMALSAMTAHALLQQQGYTLNPF
ncbi:MAG: DsrE family protein [Hyphomonas sp.]|uniref:DsrE family protein n=1 Tax=Hyphomonas sp. TaxID=87 RepID=UPI003528B58F